MMIETKDGLKETIAVLTEQLRDQKELNEFHRKINGELHKELEDMKAKKVCLCDDDKWEYCIWMVNCMSVIPKMK